MTKVVISEAKEIRMSIGAERRLERDQKYRFHHRTETKQIKDR